MSFDPFTILVRLVAQPARLAKMRREHLYKTRILANKGDWQLRIGDQIITNYACDIRRMYMPSYATGHHCDILVEPGKTEIIVDGTSDTTVSVEWHYQGWHEFESGDYVELESFEHGMNIEYLDKR